MPNEVKIDVRLSGAAQASADAGKVAQGLDKLSQAARDGGTAAQKQAAGAAEAGKNITSLGETAEKGIRIGRNFSEALQGNVLALFDVVATLKLAGAAIKTSFIGVIALGLTSLANFLPTLIDKLSGKKSSLQEGFDAAREAAERLNSAKMEELQARLEVIKTKASAARAELEQIQAAADKLDDSEMAADLAANKADRNLTENEKALRERDIRGNYAAAKRNRNLSSMDVQESLSKEEIDQLTKVALGKAEELAAIFTKVDSDKARRGRLAEERLAAETELKNISGFPISKGGALSEEDQARVKRASQLSTRLGKIRAEEDALNSPEVLDLQRRDYTMLFARRKEYDVASKGLSDAVLSGEGLRKKNTIERASLRYIEAADVRRSDAEQGILPGTVPIFSNPDPRQPGLVQNARNVAPTKLEFSVNDNAAKTGEEIAQRVADSIAERDKKLIQAFEARMKALMTRQPGN